MKTIAIANRKGGVGKTTTALNLAAGLKGRGYRVLSVDLDSQKNLSQSLGHEEAAQTIAGVLYGEIPAHEAIVETGIGDLIPGSQHLSGADMTITETGKEYRLKEALEPLQDQYDFAVIDCPPALTVLTINALTASDYVIIPALEDVYSVNAIKDLYKVIQTVRKYCNRSLQIAGVLLVKHGNTKAARKAAEWISELAQAIGSKTFQTVIRESVVVREAQALNEDLLSYAPKSKPAQDYEAFAGELLEDLKMKPEKGIV